MNNFLHKKRIAVVSAIQNTIEDIKEIKRREKRAFRIAKTYLRPGLYYFSDSTHEIKPVDRQAWHIRSMPHRIVVRGGKKKGLSSIGYNSGYGKIILFMDDMVYGYYHTSQGYVKAKKNYEMYGQLLNYPCVDHVSFNDRLQSVSMSCIHGTTYYDKSYARMVVRALLTWELSAESKKDAAGNTLFLQHGDAFFGNMIWTDENHFVFIDLDSIGYYPPLFDVIWYLRYLSYDLQGMIHLLRENEELLDEVCIKAGIDITDNLFDVLFSEYVMYILNNRKSYIYSFSFLTCENTQPYPKTNQLLRNMAGDDRTQTKSEGTP